MAWPPLAPTPTSSDSPSPRWWSPTSPVSCSSWPACTSRPLPSPRPAPPVRSARAWPRRRHCHDRVHRAQRGPREHDQGGCHDRVHRAQREHDQEGAVSLMAHYPINHHLRQPYRFLAALVGLFLLLFGVLGLAESWGDPFFYQGSDWVLGLRTNPAASWLSTLAGLVVIARTVLCGHAAHQ